MFKGAQSKPPNADWTAAKFETVDRDDPGLPGWMDPAASKTEGPEIISLRPPKIPTGLQPDTGEVLPAAEMHSSPAAEAAHSSESWLLALGELGAEPSNDSPKPQPRVQSVAPAARALDTAVDELNPRADEEAASAIAAAVEQMLTTRGQVLAESGDTVFQLVTAIARRVLAREVAADPALVRRLILEGVAAINAQDHVRIVVGPFFRDVLEDIRRSVEAQGISTEVVVEPSIGRCGCRIESQWGSVDESVEQRLASVLEGISLYPPAPRD